MKEENNGLEQAQPQTEFIFTWTLDNLTCQIDNNGDEVLNKQVWIQIPVQPWETD